MYCPKCGKELPNDSRFCPNCGNEISHSRDMQTGTHNSSAYDKAKTAYFKQLKLGLILYMVCCALALLYVLLLPEYKLYITRELISSIVILIAMEAFGVVLNAICAVVASKTFNSALNEIGILRTKELTMAEQKEFKPTSTLYNAICTGLTVGSLLILLLRYAL